MKVKDITGERFGRLVVTNSYYPQNKTTGGYSLKWFCECDCGKTTVADLGNLISGAIKSCGCYRKEKMRKNGIKAAKDFSKVSINRIYTRYKNGAKKRNIDFKISKQEMSDIIKMPCFYCGEPNGNRHTMSWSKSHKDKIFYYNGIDRVDSSRGYNIENIIPCCGICNTMKMDYSIDEFMAKCLAIVKHRGIK